MSVVDSSCTFVREKYESVRKFNITNEFVRRSKVFEQMYSLLNISIAKRSSYFENNFFPEQRLSVSN